MQLLESGEMYLETILILSQNLCKVRSIDVANYTGYSKPSVSRAVNLLKDNGYIGIDTEGYITLESAGTAVATRIYERHKLLSSLLMKLGVNEKTATADACKIEHDISDETFEQIKKFCEDYLENGEKAND